PDDLSVLRTGRSPATGQQSDQMEPASALLTLANTADARGRRGVLVMDFEPHRAVPHAYGQIDPTLRVAYGVGDEFADEEFGDVTLIAEPPVLQLLAGEPASEPHRGGRWRKRPGDGGVLAAPRLGRGNGELVMGDGGVERLPCAPRCAMAIRLLLAHEGTGEL